MIHPLVEDLEHLKDSEIENKILELSKKYWQTHNPDLQYQIRMMLDIYKENLYIRRMKLLEQQSQNRNQDLDKLIKVN